MNFLHFTGRWTRQRESNIQCNAGALDKITQFHFYKERLMLLDFCKLGQA
jgi:hypothetical protein